MALLLKLLSSLVLVAALLEKPSGKLAIRDAALVDTADGATCCCTPPNCTCCDKAITSITVSITGIADSSEDDLYCTGCSSLNKNIAIPWDGDCTGSAIFKDSDSLDGDPYDGEYDVNCYIQDDPDVLFDDYSNVVYTIDWAITCDFDFGTGLYSLKLTVWLWANRTGRVDLVTWEKEVTDLEEEESKDCSLLNGLMPVIFNIGNPSPGADCDYSGATCTVTINEAA